MSLAIDTSDGTASLLGRDRDDLAAVVAALGQPAYRAKQLWHWIYVRGAADFQAMDNLPKALRAGLAERHGLARPAVSRAQHSQDGTRKWLLRFADGQEAESVFIPEPDRGTLCVSSQVGCTLTCAFCHTGTQRLVRNLEAAEIVGQILLARDALDDWAADDKKLTNIVMMGMGEPLYNFEAVAAALRVAMDRDGLAMPRRRITLSTAGVVPMMQRCARELGVNQAVSLHAVRDELRDVLVPLNRKYPIAELLAACRDYTEIAKVHRLTFEYVMLKDVNDSPADAHELARRLQGLPAKVNLIPFNPWPGAPYECASRNAIQRFSTILQEAGLEAPVRTPRGRDIMAACGQLKSASVKARAATRRATAHTPS
jgi:23S rRNA (adenine2503-C2)-methyltransferase